MTQQRLEHPVHSLCLEPPEWAAKHVLCFFCYQLQADCRCRVFACCSEATA